MSENIVIEVIKSIGGVIRAIAGPIQLLGSAAISVVVLAAMILFLGQKIGLTVNQGFYLIVGLVVSLIVIVVFIGVYILRGGGGGGEKPKTVKQALARFAADPEIPSPLPVMVMTTPDLVVRRVSRSAKRFFGKDENASIDTVVGRPVAELIGEMQKFLNPMPAYWSDLGLDQARVIKELIEGEITYARLPVRFNSAHPAYQDKTFVPVITERDVVGKGDDKLTIVRILYLDIAELPRNLFTERVWNEAVEGLDLQDLAQELEEIKTAFAARVAARAFAEKARLAARAFEEDEDGGRERCDALKDAIEKLQQGGAPSTLDDLSKAGWFELRDEASRMPKRPQQVLKLIDAVLGRV